MSDAQIFSSQRAAIVSARFAISELYELAELMPASFLPEHASAFMREVNTILDRAKTLKRACDFLAQEEKP